MDEIRHAGRAEQAQRLTSKKIEPIPYIRRIERTILGTSGSSRNENDKRCSKCEIDEPRTTAARLRRRTRYARPLCNGRAVSSYVRMLNA